MSDAFRTTRWSVVSAAGRWRAGAGGDEARAALGELIEAYWPPLYAYARRRGAGPEAAADSVQGFFARLVEKGGLAAENDGRGRFRAFVLRAFQHHCANEHARSHAQKRGGGHAPISLEAGSLEREERAVHEWKELGSTETPERSFERRWALQVMQRALARLGLEQDRAGRGELFALLRPHLAPGGEPPSHAEVAALVGTSEGAVKVALHRLRRRYGELVREEVAGTLTDPAEVDAELGDLLAALGD